MTWATVAQALVLLGAASIYMWVSGRDREEPTAADRVEHARVQELQTLAETKRRLLLEHANKAGDGLPTLADIAWEGAQRVQKRISQIEAQLDGRIP